jgi:hypothetical protein
LNGDRIWTHFRLARLACLPFCVLGTAVCYLWARDLYGTRAGVLASLIWSLSPSVLAHGQAITPDVGAAALAGWAGYLFWRFLGQPTWGRATFAGLSLGFALLSKLTLLALVVVWPLLAAVYGWRRWRPDGAFFSRTLKVTYVLGLAVYVLNAGYLFEGTGTRLGEFEFRSELLSGVSGPPRATGANRFAETLLGALPLPVPKWYVLGLDFVRQEMETGYATYLLGQWKHGGWWHYYVCVLLFKEPLGTLVLVALAVSATISPSKGGGVPRFSLDELCVLLPGIVLFVLVSSNTGVNRDVRYILPCFPFLFVWAAKAAMFRWNVAPWRAALTAVATGWMVVSSLLASPHYLSYFNELAGGPAGGPRFLLHSNVDWGQDLYLLRDWLRENDPGPVGLAETHIISPAYAGIEDFYRPNRWPAPPEQANEPLSAVGPQPGWYVISANHLYGFPTGLSDWHTKPEWFLDSPSLRYFQMLEPVDRIGFSLYVYHVRIGDANRMRQALGLPPLEEKGR